jgi:uncharacterized protein YtpQ (UPF0354 family)
MIASDQVALIGLQIVLFTLIGLTVLAVILRAVSRLRKGMARQAGAAADRGPPAARARFDPDRIVPVLRDSAWPARVLSIAAEKGIAAGSAEFYAEPLNEHLAVFYGYDPGFLLEYLYRDQIEAAGLPVRDLRARSVRNLLAMLPPIDVQDLDGVCLVVAGTCYESSLLLEDSLWTAERFAVDGDIVVAIPRQEVLIVTGSRDAGGLARVRRLAAEIEEESGAILTPHLFVRRSGRWQTFE